MKRERGKKIKDAIYIPSNMTSEEFESYAAVNNEFPTEEAISETHIIRELEKYMFASVKTVILKMTILCQILSLLPLPSSLLKTFENLSNKTAMSLTNHLTN
ncbi:hypothetical protein HZS_1049 [Henneguya salminicola]|nr:hypothetical protein HZS_1049 [Henneguya salminicola]